MGGEPWGCRASIPLASLSLLTPLHKRRSVPCPQLTRLRRGPPFFLACLQQSAHACLPFHNRAELCASARRPHKAGALPAEEMSIQERQAIYKTPLYPAVEMLIAGKTVVPVYTPLLIFSNMKCKELLVSFVSEKDFYLFIYFPPSTKERKTHSEIGWCNCKPHQLFWGLVGGSGKQSQFIFAADLSSKQVLL